MLITANGLMLKEMVKLDFKASNNEAEYEALLAGLRMIITLKVKQVQIFSDSQLVVY